MSNVISIEEWLKTAENAIKPKKDGEKLSAYDEQENRALYNQYVREAELLSQRKEAEAKLQGQRESALRDNYIAQAQAQKKAEDALKFQGMTTGLSESSLVDLYAQGAAARANIINANNDAKNDIFSEYRRAIAESNAKTNDTIAGIDALRAEDEEQKTALNVSKFSDLLAAYSEEGSDVDIRELKEAYKNYQPYLNEKDDFDIISKYKAYLNDEASAAKNSPHIYLTEVLNKYGETNGFKYIEEVLGQQGLTDLLVSLGDKDFTVAILTKLYGEETAKELTSNISETKKQEPKTNKQILEEANDNRKKYSQGNYSTMPH